MWIDRPAPKERFIRSLNNLKNQVIIVRGARQVGKTSFINNCLKDFNNNTVIKINLLYATTMVIQGEKFYGRDFLGPNDAQDLIKNIQSLVTSMSNNQAVLVFIDEVDQQPRILEAIQLLASLTDQYKFILTGSNLENIAVKNVATGRKLYLDLAPITYIEFLRAFTLKNQQEGLFSYYQKLSPQNPPTAFYHQQLTEIFKIFLRLGGIPKIIDQYLDPNPAVLEIPYLIKDLAFSIEENVKAILGEKTKLYEYEDVLRKIAYYSLDTLKLSHLQVQHAGRSEAAKLLNKSCGARVIHKIRLYSPEQDLSKYVLFDHGFAHYLLNGSDLINSVIQSNFSAILLETYVANELISQLPSRDDLNYWKSSNKAELEFLLRSPKFIGIDVKKSSRKSKSLDSFALTEEGAGLLVNISDELPKYYQNYQAHLPTIEGKREIPLLQIPHYLSGRLLEFL